MFGVKVPRNEADRVRRFLLQHSLLNHQFKIKRSDKHVFIPLIHQLDKETMNRIDVAPLEMVETKFEVYPNHPRSLKDYLKNKIPDKKIAEIKKSFDILGEIVILEIPPELEAEKYLIGEAALNFTKRQAVYRKSSQIKGVIRTRELEHLAGDDASETIHQEYGSKFLLDVRKVYFSPRLAAERGRIVEQVKGGEIIIDMFTGVGPFSVSIARRHAVQIYAVDINPDAIYYLKKNIKINKVQERIMPRLGDVKEVLKNENIEADRIIMNLPETARKYLKTAIKYLKSGGTLNYYEFAANTRTPVERIKKAAYPREVRIIGARRVKSRSPGVWHVGIDAQIY